VVGSHASSLVHTPSSSAGPDNVQPFQPPIYFKVSYNRGYPVTEKHNALILWG
jgi:hypothetical protein